MTRREFEKTVGIIKSSYRNPLDAIPALINIKKLYARSAGTEPRPKSLFMWAARKAIS